MARRVNGANQIQRFTPRSGENVLSKRYRPFWFPALNYYLSVVVLTIFVLFIIWAILSDGDAENSWLLAGFVAFSFVFCGVLLREGLLRKLQKRYLANQKRLDDNLKSIRVKHKTDVRDGKLTIEKNTEIIDKIKQMSEAARVLSNLPDGHFEVFQACNEYLSLNSNELKTVGVGSPRIAALIKGRKAIQRLHKLHLLNWAEIQSRLLTGQANRAHNSLNKIEKAEEALNVLESALQFYSDEKKLLDSKEAIDNFIVSIKFSRRIEQAQKATKELEYDEAINFYQECLTLLSINELADNEKQTVAKDIIQEIEKIKQIQSNKRKMRQFSKEMNVSNEYTND